VRRFIDKHSGFFDKARLLASSLAWCGAFEEHVVDATSSWPHGSLRYINNKCGDIVHEESGCLDFSTNPAYELCSNEVCFVGIIQILEQLDRCPLYEFRFTWGGVLRLVGNFREYVTQIAISVLLLLVQNFIEVEQVLESDPRILLLQIECLAGDLHYFSNDLAVPTVGLTRDSFISKAALMHDFTEREFLDTLATRGSRSKWYQNNKSSAPSVPRLKIDAGYVNQLLSTHQQLIQNMNACQFWRCGNYDNEIPDYICGQLQCVNTKIGDGLNFTLVPVYIFSTPVIDDNDFGTIDGTTILDCPSSSICWSLG
jgi:hypothetical protein